MKKRASQVTKRKWSLNALKSPIQEIFVMIIAYQHALDFLQC